MHKLKKILRLIQPKPLERRTQPEEPEAWFCLFQWMNLNINSRPLLISISHRMLRVPCAQSKTCLVETRTVLEERGIQLEKHKADNVLTLFISNSILICILEPSKNKGRSTRKWNLTSQNLTRLWFESLFLFPSWEVVGLDRITHTHMF